jgi:4-hydroxy-2-oxoheptanedioate aldolase
MRPNPLRDRLLGDQPAFGAWCAIPSSVTTEVMATAGFDYVCVDLQHGLGERSDAIEMLQAITTGAATPTVRVPSNDWAAIGRALDAGAMAVVVPMVNDREQAEAAVAACRYAPQGTRSFGPVRAAAIEGDDYFEMANETITCIPMIETVEAIAELDEILAVPGVEVIYVGPADLSVSLGFGPRTQDNEADFVAALDTIVEACGRHDVVPGIHANASLAARRLEQGFRMITVSADLIGLRTQVALDLATVRKTGAAADADSLY